MSAALHTHKVRGVLIKNPSWKRILALCPDLDAGPALMWHALPLALAGRCKHVAGAQAAVLRNTPQRE